MFTKNRDRLLDGEIAAKFLRTILPQPRVKVLLSDDRFSVDGTLIQVPPAAMQTERALCAR